jgi:aminomethyltransferase
MLSGRAWRFVTETAGEAAAVPAGLAARQMLRIESGRPGSAEFAEAGDPASAGCGDRVAMDHEFAGREALEAILAAGPPRRLCGLLGPAAGSDGETPAASPEPGGDLLDAAGRTVGRITSVCRSANLRRIAALAVVDRSAEGPLRAGEGMPALEIRQLPLYRPVRPD